VAAIIIVKPWLSLPTPEGHDTPAHLTGSSAAIFVAGIVFFYLIQVFGEKLVAHNTRLEEQSRKYANSQLLSGPGVGTSRAVALERKRKSGSRDRPAPVAATPSPFEESPLEESP
jgi:hypothetical protein